MRFDNIPMTKATEILSILTNELTAGTYPVDSHFPSEYDLAQRFGISRLTANKIVTSLVASGFLQRGVRGAGTRVLNVARESQQGRVVFLGSIIHPAEIKSLQGVLSAAQSNGYSLEIAQPPEQNLKDCLIRLNDDKKVVGIVTISYWRMPEEYCPRVPVIYVDMPDPLYHPEKHYVATPNLEAFQKMMDGILERGHREIVIYTSNNYQYQHALYRVQGALEKMREAGIPDVEKRLFVAMDYTEADAVENLRKILTRYPKTTLIATTSDDLVRTMLKAMKTLEIPYPGQITLTGFGNITDISMMHQIPTVEQNHFQLGVQACTSLIELYEKRCDSIPNIQYVGYSMVNMNCIPRVSP